MCKIFTLVFFKIFKNFFVSMKKFNKDIKFFIKHVTFLKTLNYPIFFIKVFIKSKFKFQIKDGTIHKYFFSFVE